MFKFLKKYWDRILSVLLFVILSFVYVRVFAIGTPYNAGETLDPACEPGEVNCIVNIIPALTAGSVIFSDGTAGLTQDNANFFWDDTNDRLGIGTTIPMVALDVVGVGKLSTGLITPKIYPSTDSTTAIQFNKADGVTNILNIDTMNDWIGIGITTPETFDGKITVVNTTKKYADDKYTYTGMKVKNIHNGGSGLEGIWVLGTDSVLSLELPSGSTFNGRANGASGFVEDRRLNGSTFTGDMVGTTGIYYSYTTEIARSAVGVWGEVNTASTGDVTNGYGFMASNFHATTGKLQNYYGFYNKGTISSSPIRSWQFYGATTHPSYFGGNVGIGEIFPTQRLTVMGGNTAVGGTTLSSEVLTNGTLTSGTSWSTTGDFALTNDRAEFIYSTGAGTLTQTVGSFTTTANGNRWYKLTLVISSVSNLTDSTATVTTSFAGTATQFDILNSGTKTIYIKSATSPGDFVISITGATSGSFTIDTLSLREITDGNVEAMGLFTGGGTKGIKIDNSGKVGIGTTSPTGNLAITQTATATGALKGIVYTGAVNTNQTLSTEIPSVTITTAGRQWATGALTTQREVLITQPTYSFVGASTITDAATLGIAGAPIKSTNATITNTHGLLIQAGAVSTATNSYGLTVNAQTGATNNYAATFLGGNVGIADTSPDALLDVHGTVCLDLNADDVCTDNTSALSDERLKTDVTNLENALNLVKELRPVRFQWNGENNTGTGTSLGFLAQEVEDIFPELVITDTAGYKNLDYSKLTAVLAGAIQDIDLKITDINNLETENSWRESILNWFADVSNGITEFVARVLRAKDKLCIGEGDDEVCITKEELLQIKNNSNSSSNDNNDTSNDTTDDTVDDTVDDTTDDTTDDTVDDTTDDTVDDDNTVDDTITDDITDDVVDDTTDDTITDDTVEDTIDGTIDDSTEDTITDDAVEDTVEDTTETPVE